MPDFIRLLPDSLANQIAAGEVVQRPASVVKELLENAIDAGASHIQLYIKDAGRTLIRVIDNGKGMSYNDARMCFERHATSKITTREDLFTIRTMGFRGEAMASIAAIARVELKTRTEGAELGTLLQIEGSEIKSTEKIVCDKGTSVAVKDLFYNVPARRNFLKSEATEFSHIHCEYMRVVLSASEVEFSLYHNDTELSNLKPGNLARRIVQLFGNNYKEQLVACKETTPYMNVHGFIGKPEYSKRKSDEQFFFVNNRYIKHYFLSKVVSDTFGRLLPEGNKPFFVMFIDIDPIHVDVNIHPTKTEIKFDDERTAEAVVRSAVKLALGTHHVVPSLDFSTPVDFAAKFDSLPKDQLSGAGGYRGSGFAPRERSAAYEWEPFFGENKRTPEPEEPEEHLFRTPSGDEEVVTFGSSMNTSTGADAALTPDPVPDAGAFHFNDSYIVSPMKSGLLVIDRRAAHERILYEKYLHTDGKQGAGAQQLLFPIRFPLSPADLVTVEEIKDEIRKLGFSFEVAGNNALVLDGIPADVTGVDERELFEGILEQYKQQKTNLRRGIQETLTATLARRLSIKPGTKITATETNAMIDRLFACQNPNYTPDGAKIFVILDQTHIEGLFR